MPDLPATTDPASLMQFFSDEAIESDDRFNADVDINKLVPLMKMGTDSKSLIIKIGDEEIKPNRSTYYVLMADIFGSRALWAPKSHEESYKAPICSTGLVDPNELKNDTSFGNWIINDDFDYPYATGADDVHESGDNVAFSCAKCPYNRFGSLKEWDTTRESSRGKACSESRTFFLHVMNREGEVPGNNMRDDDLFFFSTDEKFKSASNPHGVIRYAVSYATNHKVIASMVMMARARKIPVMACIFKLTVDHEDLSSGFTVAKMNISVAGVPTKDTFATVKNDTAPWVSKFVERNKRANVDIAHFGETEEDEDNLPGEQTDPETGF